MHDVVTFGLHAAARANRSLADRLLLQRVGDELGRAVLRLGLGKRGRAQFDNEHWGADPGGPGYRRRPYDFSYDRDWGPPFPSFPPFPEIARDDDDDDDGLPLPSWPWLISRMRRELAMRCHEDEQESLSKFFRDEGPLDCAQLFRQTVGESNYREVLQAQFNARRHEFVKPTPSHEALVALELPLIFTTNYDELIEDAHSHAGLPIRVSADCCMTTSGNRSACWLR